MIDATDVVSNQIDVKAGYLGCKSRVVLAGLPDIPCPSSVILIAPDSVSQISRKMNCFDTLMLAIKVSKRGALVYPNRLAWIIYAMSR